MNKKLTSIAALITGVSILLFSAGCSWFKNITVDQKIALASTVAYEATFIGVAVDLKAHPERRNAYEAAQAFLSAFLATNGGAGDLAVGLSKLPVKELQGDTGAIIISGIVSVYSLAKDMFIDVANTPAWVNRVGGAIERGLKDALALSPAKLDKVSNQRRGFVVPRR